MAVESCRGTPVPARCSSASPRHPAATSESHDWRNRPAARAASCGTPSPEAWSAPSRAQPTRCPPSQARLNSVAARTGSRGIPRPCLHERPEARAALHPATLASALVQRDGARRVALHPSASVVHHAEAGARVADRPIARAAEQRGGARIVLEDVLALLEPRGEAVARDQVTRLAREIELLGFLVARVACGEAREREGDQEPGVGERGGQTWGGRRHPGAAWAGTAGKGRKQAIRRVRLEVSSRPVGELSVRARRACCRHTGAARAGIVSEIDVE